MQVFLVKFISKDAQNLNIIANILNSAQQPGCISVTSFCPIDFANWLPKSLLTTTLGYGSSWTILFWATHNRIEDNEVDNPLEKIDFADLVNDTTSVTGFSYSSQFWLEQNDMSHKHGLAATTISKWQPLKSLLLRQTSSDSRHFKGWNFSWMFTCYRRVIASFWLSK